MNKKLYIFDLDGTLTPERPSSSSPYIKSLLPGVMQKLYSLPPYSIFGIVTNQKNRSKNDRDMLDYFAWIEFQVLVNYIEVATKDNPEDLKPNPSLINKMIETLLLQKSDAVMIGNSGTDYEAASRARIDFVYANAFFGWK
jgi:HAD superfamily hydrolase (TIGR01662 family)